MTNEELNKLKDEYKSLKGKLDELSEDEIVQVTGGTNFNIPDKNNPNYEMSIYPDNNPDKARDTFDKKF